jgi:hypothetical protein
MAEIRAEGGGKLINKNLLSHPITPLRCGSDPQRTHDYVSELVRLSAPLILRARIAERPQSVALLGPGREAMNHHVMTRQTLIRHGTDIVRRAALIASIVAGATMWAFTMIRTAGIELG